MWNWRHARKEPLKGDLLVALSVACLALAAIVFAPQLLNDGDTFWHIRAGAWMLDHRSILRTDPFSYTFAGKPWQTHEWLAEIAFAGIYRLAGWAGVVLLAASAFAAAGVGLAWTLTKYVSRPATLLISLLGLASMSASLLARPHMLALPLLVFWTGALADARARRRAPSLWLVPLMCLWANVHASFVAGLALALALGFEALIEDEQAIARVQQWGVFILASLLATLATPHGLSGLLFPLDFASRPELSFVGEWQPTDLTKLAPFEVGAAVVLYVVITRRVQVGIVRAALLLAMTILAFQHARHQMLLAAVSPLLLAEPLGAALRHNNESFSVRPSRALAFMPAIAVVAIAAARLAIPLPLRDGNASPVTAFARLPANLRSERVLNDYAFGGFLIFKNVRPFIDSRAELYGHDWLGHYAALERGSASFVLNTLVAQNAAWTIFSPANPLARTMDNLPGWKRVYADRWAVVHERADMADREASRD